MNTKRVGILGGMGIDVTAELLTRIIDITNAKREQDHIPIIINHNPKIPDRTQAILYGGEDPLPSLKSSLAVLEKVGVDFIAIPCNTAHYYYKEMQEDISTPIIHMIDSVMEECVKLKNNLTKVGLLATTGTVKTGLYQDKFSQRKIQMVFPNEKDQDIVLDNIMKIKAREDLGNIKKVFLRIGRELINQSAEIIVIGCTDISLALKDGDLEVPIVDSLQVLAERVVKEALEGR